MYCPNRECPDLKETGMPGEYVKGITICPFCNSYLVEEMPDMHPEAMQVEKTETTREEETFSMMDALQEDLVGIKSCGSRQDADLAITCLLDHGIDVFESEEDIDGTLPAIGFGPPIRLLVPKSQAKDARILLSGVKAPAVDDEEN